eukprot:scaffold9577_cov130-Isochrysis_galbana.AAC.1
MVPPSAVSDPEPAAPPTTCTATHAPPSHHTYRRPLCILGVGGATEHPGRDPRRVRVRSGCEWQGAAYPGRYRSAAPAVVSIFGQPPGLQTIRASAGLRVELGKGGAWLVAELMGGAVLEDGSVSGPLQIRRARRAGLRVELGKGGAWLVAELMGGAVLEDGAGAEDDDAVAVHDGAEAVGDGQHGGVL